MKKKKRMWGLKKFRKITRKNKEEEEEEEEEIAKDVRLYIILSYLKNYNVRINIS